MGTLISRLAGTPCPLIFGALQEDTFGVSWRRFLGHVLKTCVGPVWTHFLSQLASQRMRNGMTGDEDPKHCVGNQIVPQVVGNLRTTRHPVVRYGTLHAMRDSKPAGKRTSSEPEWKQKLKTQPQAQGHCIAHAKVKRQSPSKPGSPATPRGQAANGCPSHARMTRKTPRPAALHTRPQLYCTGCAKPRKTYANPDLSQVAISLYDILGRRLYCKTWGPRE